MDRGTTTETGQMLGILQLVLNYGLIVGGLNAILEGAILRKLSNYIIKRESKLYVKWQCNDESLTSA